LHVEGTLTPSSILTALEQSGLVTEEASSEIPSEFEKSIETAFTEEVPTVTAVEEDTDKLLVEESVSELTKTSDQYSALATSEEDAQSPFKHDGLTSVSEANYGLTHSGKENRVVLVL